MDRRLQITLGCAALAAVAILAGVYWDSVQMLMRVWRRPDYSHGYLVPFFSIFLLWVRRDMLRDVRWEGSWWGAVVLGISALFYICGGIAGYNILTAFTIIPTVLGVVILLGGWPAVRWSWPAIGFLIFAIQLPNFIESTAMVPLRRIGTIASTYALQTVGLGAVAEGNVILLSEYQIGVAEACSGLRMLMTSLALAFGLAFVINRPVWERIVIVLSAVPIALLTNVFRITLTGLCFEWFGQEVAEKVFHDLAGWLMMPMAVGLLWLLMIILANMTIEPHQGPALGGALVDRQRLAKAKLTS